jgi:hypothetical protein
MCRTGQPASSHARPRATGASVAARRCVAPSTTRAPLTSGGLLTESTANGQRRPTPATAAGRPQQQRPIAAGARGFSSAPHPAPHRRTQPSGAASRWEEPAGKSLLERACWKVQRARWKEPDAALQRSSTGAGTAPARASRQAQRSGLAWPGLARPGLAPTRRCRSRGVPAVPAATVAESQSRRVAPRHAVGRRPPSQHRYSACIAPAPPLPCRRTRAGAHQMLCCPRRAAGAHVTASRTRQNPPFSPPASPSLACSPRLRSSHNRPEPRRRMPIRSQPPSSAFLVPSLRRAPRAVARAQPLPVVLLLLSLRAPLSSSGRCTCSMPLP